MLLKLLINNIDINSLPPGIQKLLPPEIAESLEKEGIDIENGKTFEPVSNKIYTNFKLPIEYLEGKYIHTLSSNVKDDLELEPFLDASSNKQSMYDYLLQPSHDFGKQMLNDWSKKYTTNTNFLKESQTILENMEKYKETSAKDYIVNCKRIEEIWTSIKRDPGFLERYYFMEWDMLKYLNKSTPFLQLMSTINLISPLTTLIFPLVMLIIPFIILKAKRISVDFQTYVKVLKDIARNHFIGKTLHRMDNLDFKTVTYMIFSVGFYFLQIYQSVVSFTRYYRNIRKINEQLYDINRFIGYSILNMDAFVKINKYAGETHSKFCLETVKWVSILKKIKQELDAIRPFSISVSKLNELGYLFRSYYELYSNNDYSDAIRYAIGFEGYMDTITGLHTNLCQRNITLAKFNKKKNTKITKQYYPPYINKPHVKNTCEFDENMIITGVNASGKTTILKTSCINIIFTQQFGCGFYEKCVLNPYKYIHSYLNIPDTSGRDSLFQAESRRCKEIIDIIKKSDKKDRHFCIFDELYSGTNPEEATNSAYALLLYLSELKNVNFILTTHYIELCNKIKENKNNMNRKLMNYQMGIIQTEKDGIKYTYKLETGICKVHGAIEILKNMDYPQEILASIQQL